MSSANVVRRQVARVLLFDPGDRLLLYFARDRVDPTNSAFWYLPGGGMDQRETPHEAVRRELVEEAGVESADLGPIVVHLRGVRFRFEGQVFVQDEWHVMGRLPEGRLGRGRNGDSESLAVAAHRWWSPTELRSSRELIYPTPLPSIVERLMREGPPPTPWEIDELTSRADTWP